MTPDRSEAPVELPPGLDKRMGLQILEMTAERVVGRMPVAGNTQPFGLWHGGASCVMAETLGSMGSSVHAGHGRRAVGVDINATHHKSATEGWVRGVATAAHRGRRLATYDVVLTHEESEVRICTARITCMLID
jgi:uncharacterized protein (TIGR00369 family)